MVNNKLYSESYVHRKGQNPAIYVIRLLEMYAGMNSINYNKKSSLIEPVSGISLGHFLKKAYIVLLQSSQRVHEISFNRHKYKVCEGLIKWVTRSLVNIFSFLVFLLGNTHCKLICLSCQEIMNCWVIVFLFLHFEALLSFRLAWNVLFVIQFINICI